jgi:hypothetical protein
MRQGSIEERPDAETGRTGRVTIGRRQSERCVERFFIQELALIKPVALVFFGEKPQSYVLGRVTPAGEIHRATVGGIAYWVLRVPHTAATSFNTHGQRGHYYKGPFQLLLKSAGLV